MEVLKEMSMTKWFSICKLGRIPLPVCTTSINDFSRATLLLEQSPTQVSNQQYLESFLAASYTPKVHNQQRPSTAKGPAEGLDPGRSGTDTLGDLESRIQLIEIYALHVLPRNGEWEYAKSFINTSEILDEERRDNYLNTLQDLEDDSSLKDEYEDALPQQRMEDVTRNGSMDSIGTETTVKAVAPALHHRSNSEIDYGIEKTEPPSEYTIDRSTVAKPIRKPSWKTQSTSKPLPARSPPKRSQSSVYKRSIAAVVGIRHVMKNMAEQISHNPMPLLQFVLFLMGIIMAFSRRDVQNRVARLTGSGWEKVRQTVGMGVKVSYI